MQSEKQSSFNASFEDNYFAKNDKTITDNNINQNTIEHLDTFNEEVLNYTDKLQLSDNSQANRVTVLNSINQELRDLTNKDFSIELKIGLYSVFSCLGIGTIGSLLFSTIISDFFLNHDGFFIFKFSAVAFFFSFIICCIMSERDSEFKWVKKLMHRTKKYKKLQKDIKAYHSKIHAMFENQHFTHAYIAQVQLKITSYEQNLLDLKEKNLPHDYNTINTLSNALIEFKSYQAILINNILKHEYLNTLEYMLSIEKSMLEMDKTLVANQALTSGQAQFIQAHEQFLKEHGINSLLNQMNPRAGHSKEYKNIL